MLRVSKNWNQETAAKKLKISVSKLSNWENAKTFPDAIEINKIEKLYDVNYSDIIFLPTKYGLTVQIDKQHNTRKEPHETKTLSVQR